jgi:hypothetical protein
MIVFSYGDLCYHRQSSTVSVTHRAVLDAFTLTPPLRPPQVLKVLEIFLGDDAATPRDPDLLSLAELALEHLKNMLLVMSAAGAFEVSRSSGRLVAFNMLHSCGCGGGFRRELICWSVGST